MKYVVDGTSLTAIADAIRAKTGKSDPLTLADMPTEVEGIETGGGGSTDQTDLAGCYTPDGTFSDRRFTWLEMMLNCSEYSEYPGYGMMGGMYNEINAMNPEDYSFYDVVVPNEITRLVAFRCRNIVTPATLMELPSYGDKGFEKMYIKATTPPLLYDNDLHMMQPIEDITIIVPIGCGNVYKSATNWSYYADRIFEGEMPI